MPDTSPALASPIGSPAPPDTGFDDFLKSYDASLQKSGKAAQGAYAATGEKIAGLQKEEQGLQPPAPPAPQPPPQQQPDRPLYEQFGSLAMAVATLGSALTRQPLTNALNAGAAVMHAFKAGDADTARANLAEWHAQTDYAIKLHDYQNELYQESLNKIRAGEKGALDELKIELGATGDQNALQVLQMRGHEGLQKFLAGRDKQMDKLQQNLPKSLYQGLQAGAMLEWSKKYGIDQGQKPTPDQLAELKTTLAQIPNPDKPANGAGAGLEASKTIEVLDDKGKVVRTVLARERKDQPGWLDSTTGKPIVLEAGQQLRQITPSTASGGRAGAQVLRQEIGGREVLSDLQNVVTMPVGSTTGMFGAVQPGTSITDALKGDLVRNLTTQDAQLMQASLASMSRELSVLMSPVYGGNWAAQQIDPLIPKEGDTVGTTIFKVARLAQSADNALEAISKSPILSNDQQEYAADLRQQIQQAVPWTSAQAQAFARQDNTAENFGDFVKRHNVGGSLPDGIPKGSKKVGTYQGKDVYKSPDGKRYQVQ